MASQKGFDLNLKKRANKNVVSFHVYQSALFQATNSLVVICVMIVK